MVVDNAQRDKINHFNVKNKELLVYDPVMPCGAFTQESNSVKLHCKIFQIKSLFRYFQERFAEIIFNSFTQTKLRIICLVEEFFQ